MPEWKRVCSKDFSALQINTSFTRIVNVFSLRENLGARHTSCAPEVCRLSIVCCFVQNEAFRLLDLKKVSQCRKSFTEEYSEATSLEGTKGST